MLTTKKIIALALCAVMTVSFVSCTSKEEQEATVKKKNAEEINKKYDEAMKDIDSSANENYDGLSFDNIGFSTYDYSLFPPSDETAVYSLEKNSFGKVNLGGTYFNSIAPGTEPYTEAESFKTKKGLSVNNTAQEFITAYAIENGKALYKGEGDTEYTVLENGTFTGKLTAVYVTKDDGFFILLDSADIRRFLKIRDENANGMYFDPKLVHDTFSDYSSIAVLDIVADASGVVTEFSICRFEPGSENELSH